MADIQGLTVTVLPQTSVSVHRFQFNGLLTNPRTGAILFDFTATPVIFPDVLATLTVAQRRQFIEQVAVWLLHAKGGVA